MRYDIQDLFMVERDDLVFEGVVVKVGVLAVELFQKGQEIDDYVVGIQVF